MIRNKWYIYRFEGVKNIFFLVESAPPAFISVIKKINFSLGMYKSSKDLIP